MPLYKTSHLNSIVGIYNCQRPSTAACKAFTTLKRRDPQLESAVILVTTEGRSLTTTFDVKYGSTQDDFFGTIFRPVASKIHSGGVIPESEVKVDVPSEQRVDPGT